MPESETIFVGNFRDALTRVRHSEREQASFERALRQRQAALAGKAQRWREARLAIPSLW